MVLTNADSTHISIELQPNRSATWQQTKFLIMAMSVFVAIIALGWWFVGIWIILPFAGFEVGLLALLMYRVSHFTYQSQHILITRDAVSVSRKKKSPVIRLARPACHIEFDDPVSDWHLPVIRLVDDVETVEVGEFLNLEDRNRLRLALQENGLMVCRRHWWKRH